MADSADVRRARRLLLLFVGALVVVVAGFVLLLVAQHHHDRVVARSDPTLVSGVGPVPGTAIPAYIAERTAALGRAAGSVTAVVSFDRYATEADARRAVGEVRIVGLLVAAPGGQPATVTGKLDDWAAASRGDAEDQRAEIKRLLDSGTVDDPDFSNFYRAEVARLTRVIDATSPSQPVVFGAVVKAGATDVQALARAPGVRLVDVAGGELAPDPTYTGLRPEETATAGTPPTRP